MFRIGDLAFIYGVWCWHAHSRVGLYAACISVVTWGRSVPDFYPSKSLVSGVRVIEWSVTTVQLVVWMLCAYQDNTCLDVVCHHITSPVLHQPTVGATFLHLSHTARNVVTVCLENRTGCRRDIFNAINTFTLFVANVQVQCPLGSLPQSNLPATTISATIPPAAMEVGFLIYDVIFLLSVDCPTQLESRFTRTMGITRTLKILALKLN